MWLIALGMLYSSFGSDVDDQIRLYAAHGGGFPQLPECATVLEQTIDVETPTIELLLTEFFARLESRSQWDQPTFEEFEDAKLLLKIAIHGKQPFPKFGSDVLSQLTSQYVKELKQIQHDSPWEDLRLTTLLASEADSRHQEFRDFLALDRSQYQSFFLRLDEFTDRPISPLFIVIQSAIVSAHRHGHDPDGLETLVKNLYMHFFLFFAGQSPITSFFPMLGIPYPSESTVSLIGSILSRLTSASTTLDALAFLEWLLVSRENFEALKSHPHFPSIYRALLRMHLLELNDTLTAGAGNILKNLASRDVVLKTELDQLLELTHHSAFGPQAIHLSQKILQIRQTSLLDLSLN